MELIIKKAGDQPDKYTGLYANSKGGTERMYAELKARIDPELFNKFQIVCSRVREFEDGKIPIFWAHDLAEDPEAAFLADEKLRKRFKHLVFVSNTQFLSYHYRLGVPYRDTTVFRNAIEPFGVVPPKPQDKVNIIYHTTPHRGLGILVDVFMQIAARHPNVHLNVYSSFGIYGWKNRDSQFQNIFDACENHPQITYHGAVDNSVVREALKTSHIFAYPSIWPETSCIAAIEAMASGCVVVAPDYAALSETVSDMGFSYRWSEDMQEHVNRFGNVLEIAIKQVNSDSVQGFLQMVKERTNQLYSWNTRIRDWNALLKSLAA